MSDNSEKVQLTIRLPKGLRDEFQAALDDRDETASQVLRRAIRQYLSSGSAPPSSNFGIPAPSAPTAPQQPTSTQAGERGGGAMIAGLKNALGLGDDDD